MQFLLQRQITHYFLNLIILLSGASEAHFFKLYRIKLDFFFLGGVHTIIVQYI